MTYLAAYNWVWLLLAALCGLAMGWIAVVHRGQGLSDDMLKKVSAFISALILASLTRILPGRFGYWLDLGLVMFAIYIIGCAVGSWLRYVVVSRQLAAAR